MRARLLLFALLEISLLVAAPACSLIGDVGSGPREGEGESSCADDDIACQTLAACGFSEETTIGETDWECVFAEICPEESSPALDCGDLDSPGFSRQGCLAARDQFAGDGSSPCPNAPAADGVRFIATYFNARACGDLAVAKSQLDDFEETCFTHAHQTLSCETTAYVGEVDAAAATCVVAFTDCSDGKEYQLDCSHPEDGCLCIVQDGDEVTGQWEPFALDDDTNFCADARRIPAVAEEKCRWFNP